MDFIEGILLGAGRAARAGWHWLAEGAGWLGHALDWPTPVLGPLLAWINPACTRAGTAAYGLLDRLPSALGLVIISALAGLLMVVAIGRTSNQPAIRRIRDDIRANLLVLRLFKEDLGVAVRAQGRLMWALLRLQGRMLQPIAIMLLPMLLIMAQMSLRYQHRSLRPGETCIVRAKLAGPGTARQAFDLHAQGPGVAVEVGPIAGGEDLAWRVRAASAGHHQVILSSGATRVVKDVVVGPEQRLVSPVRPGMSWISQLLYPAEPPLPAGLGLRAIEVDYPARVSRFDGADWWLVWFMVLSIGFGVLCKGPLGVAM